MKRQQRKLDREKDEFLVRVPSEIGILIRALADRKSMSYSAYIGETVEKVIKEETLAIIETFRNGRIQAGYGQSDRILEQGEENGKNK